MARTNDQTYWIPSDPVRERRLVGILAKMVDAFINPVGQPKDSPSEPSASPSPLKQYQTKSAKQNGPRLNAGEKTASHPEDDDEVQREKETAT